MSTRRPFQPLSPLPSGNLGANYDDGYSYKAQLNHHNHSNDRTHGIYAMAHEQSNALPDGISEALSDLENDADADDFDRLLIRNARDERRLNDALHGRVQPFSKARKHPRIGVTLENLERHHDPRNDAIASANAQPRWESPPSSNGSARDDPAIQPPSGWGRKAKVKRNWMRTITADEPRDPGTPQHHESPEAHIPGYPRSPIENSPLSHKSSMLGTPANSRQNRLDDDWSFDLNNASVIASTPYIPRNTALDDIRAREMDSLKEDFGISNRQDSVRPSSPTEERQRSRSRSSSVQLIAGQSNRATGAEQTHPKATSPRQLRNRTKSWQTIGKSPPVTSQDVENSPVVVYKESVESVSLDPRTGPTRPIRPREDSHDLLRRLARLSSTPSPGRGTEQPQTAAPRLPANSSTTMPSDPIAQPNRDGAAPARLSNSVANPSEEVASIARPGQLDIESSRISRGIPSSLPQRTDGESSRTPQARPPSSHQQTESESGRRSQTHPTPSQQRASEKVASTPAPAERSLLNPKTPVVTGAWIDTPRAGTVLRPPTEAPSVPTQPTNKTSPNKKQNVTGNQPTVEEEEAGPPQPEVIVPNLPTSAVHAIIEEWRTNGQHPSSSDFGESTINSLEELMTPRAGTSDAEDDTLQSLKLPTTAPRNAAERQHQDENQLLHRMNNSLRAARINLRDVSRGIGKVERRVEHIDGPLAPNQTTDARPPRTAANGTCPCTTDGGAHMHAPAARWTLWRGLKGLFYDVNLKRTSRWGWGLTGLSITLLTILTWFIIENTACEAFCHHHYAHTMSGYGVTYDAPKFPFVVPTMTYRALVRPWWRPLCSWLLLPLWNYLVAADAGVGSVGGRVGGRDVGAGIGARDGMGAAGAGAGGIGVERTVTATGWEEAEAAFVRGMGADEVLY